MSDKTPGEQKVEYWSKELQASWVRMKKWLERADHAVKLYSCDNEVGNTFNILYANTETLLPAFYNQTPKPIVKARHGEPYDPLAKAVADAVRRGLTWQMDDPDERYTSFDDLMESIVLNALVPGRGVLWFTFDAAMKVEAQKVAPVERRADKDSTDSADPSDEILVPEEPEGQEVAEEPYEDTEYESVCGQVVPYDRFRMGFAKTWKGVPWISREHRMTKADWEANGFPKMDAAAEIAVFHEPLHRMDQEKSGDESQKEGTANVAVVHEVWHKHDKEVIFVCEQYKEGVLKTVSDPLGLPGFFPTPKPLQLIPRPNSLDTIVPYETYRPQARELNKISVRINKIVEALKVRGFYDSRLKELVTLLDGEDNLLIPATGAAGLTDKGGLDKLIWTMPIDKLIGVLQQLYVQRQQIKTVIYEITGISDIIRGSTVASETATAQELKSTYGTMRLKRSQRMVQLYVRGCMRIMASIMGKHYSPRTWQSITGLKLGSAQEKQQAQQALQGIQMQMQGMDPAMMQQDPAAQQMMQQAQQLQQQATMVTWEEVIAAMQSDLTRGYKIDIETNSTIDPEAAMEQKQAAELFGAIGQLTQNLGGMVNEGKLPLGAFKALMLAVTRRFQFGSEVEEHLMAMADQMPQQQDPKIQKQVEQLQKDQQKLAQEQQQLEIEKMEIQGEKKMIGMQKKMAIQEIQMERDQALMDIQMAQQKSQQAVVQKEMGLQQKAQQTEFGFQQREQGFQNTVQQTEADLAMQQQEGMHKQKMTGMQQEQRLAQKAQKQQSKPKPGGQRK